jgi:hypothetical protein
MAVGIRKQRARRLIGDCDKANQWKTNYHTARALINVAKLQVTLNAPSDVKCPFA